MSKGLWLGHAGVNRKTPRRLVELHRFTPLRDPALGFLCVYNLLGREKKTGEKWLITHKRAAMSQTGGVI